MSRPSKPRPKTKGAAASDVGQEPGRAPGKAVRPPPTAAQTRLIEEHVPFVRAIARKLRDQMPAIEFDDLVGFGMQGLLEASQRYDHRHGVVFSTFAYYRIRGAMFDGIRSMGWLPRGEYLRARFEERASAYLENLEAREAGVAADGSAEEEVRALADGIYGVAAVFITLLTEAHEHHLLDDRPQAEEQLLRHQLLDRVKRVLKTLPEKEQRLINQYYFGDQTLEEVGESMGLSKSWTSRLHARAVALLREGLLAETAEDL